MGISPTVEGFRAAFRRPSLTLAEITWRWTAGAAAAALFLFGLFEYLRTLPVNAGELLFLKSGQPYLIGQAIAHILRGSLSRVVLSAMIATILLSWLWIMAASIGRMATVRGLLEYFRKDVAAVLASGEGWPMRALTRLNFLRAVVAMAAAFGLIGAMILAGFASPDKNPRPGLAFFLFLPIAGLVFLIWSALNWLLSLAGVFAVRDGEDVMGSISAAVSFLRDRTGAVLAVSTWTGLAHLVAFVIATTAVSMPMGFAAIVPWRLVVLAMLLVTLAYFVIADWLYMARLAGYVCIAEVPEALLVSQPPVPTSLPPHGGDIEPQTGIDRTELILSDVPISAG